jgi:hypothetical protein
MTSRSPAVERQTVTENGLRRKSPGTVLPVGAGVQAVLQTGLRPAAEGPTGRLRRQTNPARAMKSCYGGTL